MRWQRHKVTSGEAISQIAEKYNTTVATIRSANNLRSNTIRAGDYLMIPVATKPLSAYSKSADARLAATQNRKRAGNKVEHVVRAARVSGLSRVVTALRIDNLPRGTGWRRATRSRSDANSWYGPTLRWKRRAPRLPRHWATTRKLRYTVRNGDSLYLIARKFRVGIEQIARWNNIDKSKILRPGQKLTMYVDVTAQSS